MGRGSRYSETYKREAVAKARASGNASQTARELGISYKSLLRWQKNSRHQSYRMKRRRHPLIWPHVCSTWSVS
jgi:transposase-like protein